MLGLTFRIVKRQLKIISSLYALMTMPEISKINFNLDNWWIPQTLFENHRTPETQSHIHKSAIDCWCLISKPKSYFISHSFCFFYFSRVRNHASQICLLIHICCLSFPKSFSILLRHRIIIWAREYNFVRPRQIDWLNYGFSCQLKWHLIKKKSEPNWIRFIISLFLACAHQLNVIAFWCVAFVCAAMLNNVSRPSFASKLIIRHFQSVVIWARRWIIQQAQTVQKGVVKKSNMHGAALKSKIPILAPLSRKELSI